MRFDGVKILTQTLRGGENMDQIVIINDELEKFIVLKVKSLDENTSSEEIIALTELVKTTAQLPRPIKFIESINPTRLNSGELNVNLEVLIASLNKFLQKIDSANEDEFNLLERKLDSLVRIARIVELLEI